MLIIRCKLIADRRLELHKSLELGRSDKCRSWYIAACIVGGERHDRPVSPPARIVGGEHCSTLASPLAGSSGEELAGTPGSALADSRNEALADIVAVLVDGDPFGKLGEPRGCTTGEALGGNLASRLVGTLAAALACIPPRAPVGTPGGKPGCRLGGAHHSSSPWGSGCSFELPAVEARWCTPVGEHIGSLGEALLGEFASIAVSLLGEGLACILAGKLAVAPHGTPDAQPVWERIRTLGEPLGVAHCSIPLSPLGGE